ncbi:ATP:corrinoid adenosyltransferase BtuR/CobO/CobP [Candidatus Tiddalikarchaeum anstoanum]|nr:ATP:corrinoid adenosyltransferase BtuR/CobO/CobP [Candidatus Tiddalikarchaeum anstoanum]
MVRVHVYTGDGEGKTLTALGLALRNAGHKYKVVIVQFMKGRKDVGEYKVQKMLSPYLKLYQFGKKEFVNLDKPNESDIFAAKKGILFAKKILKEKIKVLILDEVNLAVAIGLLKKEDVLSLIDDAPKDMLVILTGRNAPEEFINKADLVTVMNDVKHPYDKGVKAVKGIEY